MCGAGLLHSCPDWGYMQSYTASAVQFDWQVQLRVRGKGGSCTSQEAPPGFCEEGGESVLSLLLEKYTLFPVAMKLNFPTRKFKQLFHKLTPMDSRWFFSGCMESFHITVHDNCRWLCESVTLQPVEGKPTCIEYQTLDIYYG